MQWSVIPYLIRDPIYLNGFRVVARNDNNVDNVFIVRLLCGCVYPKLLPASAYDWQAYSTPLRRHSL